MTLAIVLGSGGAAGAGSPSLDTSVADGVDNAAMVVSDADDVIDTVSQTTDDVTDTVSQTTDDVTDTVSQTTDDVTDTVSQTTDDVHHSASGAANDVSTAANHSTDDLTRSQSDTAGGATSDPDGVRGHGAQEPDAVSNIGIGRAGSSPSGDGPLFGRRYFAPASFAIAAAASAREVASQSALSLRPCGNLHRTGDPVQCSAGDQPAGVLGIVLGSTGIAVLSLLVLAAALAASGTASFAIGRIREA